MVQQNGQTTTLRNTAADSGDVIVTASAAGLITTWNRAAQRLTGYTSREIIGQPLTILVAKPARELRSEAILLTVSSEGRFTSEGLCRRQDGAEFWALTLTLPMHDAQGRLLGYTHLIRDLSQQRAQDARMQLLEAAVAGLPFGVLITDTLLDRPGPRILYANPAFSRMTGYAASDLLGQTPRLLQGPATDREMLRRLRAALQLGLMFVGETINYRKDGQPYPVQFQIIPVRDDQQVITNFVSVEYEVKVQPTGLHEVAAVPDTTRVVDFSVNSGPLTPNSSLRGKLEDVGGAGSLVQMLMVLNPSGALTLNGDIRLFFRDGRIVFIEHPRMPHLSGLEAAVHAFHLERGTFEFSLVDLQPEAVLSLDPVSVALEAARRFDEAKHSGEWPALQGVELEAEGVFVLPDVKSALAFVASLGTNQFRGRTEYDPHLKRDALVLRGRGLRVVVLEGQMRDLPKSMIGL